MILCCDSTIVARLLRVLSPQVCVGCTCALGAMVPRVNDWSQKHSRMLEPRAIQALAGRAVGLCPASCCEHVCRIIGNNGQHVVDKAIALRGNTWKTGQLLKKRSLRQNPGAFVADDCAIRQMFHEHTSGTTGKSLDLWWSRKTVRAWYALFEARCRHWHGVSRQDRWAILGGQLITPRSQRRPPFWVWNAALNQLYMSSYHLAPDLIPYYFDALKRYRISYIFGYTSSLYAIANEALRAGRKDLKMTVAITNAEPVFDYQRRTMAKLFNVQYAKRMGWQKL